MNAVIKDDALFPIINLNVPEDERLAKIAEPYHWAGHIFTQYPFPVKDGGTISLLGLSSNAEVEATGLATPCDSIGDLGIRAIVFQDPTTGNVYRRFLATDRFYGDRRRRGGTLTDLKGNLSVTVNAEWGTAQFKAHPSVIGVYFEGYRFDTNRRPRE